MRILYLMGDRFTGYSAGAAVQDAKLGVQHFTAWERCAVVSDTDWIRHAVSAFGWMIPGKVETFGLGELERAKEWVAAAD